MAIAFNKIPQGQLTPFVFIEFDNSYGSNTSNQQIYNSLIFGEKSSTGNAVVNQFYLINTLDDAAEKFGADSEIYSAIAAYKSNDSDTALYACSQIADKSATQTKFELILTGAVTSDSGLKLKIADVDYISSFATNDAASAVATKIAADINADKSANVTAVATAAQVTFTSKKTGLNSKFLDVTLIQLPIGIKSANGITKTNGTVSPSLADAIKALPADAFNIIISCYNDDANLKLLKAELEKRWSPEVQLDGVAFSFAEGNVTAITAKTKKTSTEHIVLVALPFENIKSPWEIVSAYAATVARAAQIDPARPFQTLGLTGLSSDDYSYSLSRSSRNQLLIAGAATYIVNRFNNILIERVVTTNTQNRSYRDVNALLTLSYLRFDFRSTIKNKFARHKLASDTVRISSNQPIVTPALARAEAISIFNNWESLGLVQNIDEFKSSLNVEIDAKDKSRLNWLLPVELINQLRITAAQINFTI